MKCCRKRSISRLSFCVLVLFNAGFCPGQFQSAETGREFYFGAAVDMSPFYGEPIYRQTLQNEFNIVVAENAFKWDAVRPSRTAFNFGDTDALVNFAESRNMKVRGHTLVWHNQLPAWLKSGNFTRAEVIRILRDHILTFVGRYRGRIWAWDVVNEAVDDSGNLRTTSFWYQKIGPEYIKMAFDFAHEADPKAILYYNDYSIEGLDPKSDAVYYLVRDLKNRRTPINGVGWQMHQVSGFRMTPQNEDNARRLTSLGLEFSMTEMDVRILLPSNGTKLEEQAEGYRSAVNFCLKNSNCKALVLWGFTDKHSWIPGVFPGYGDALIFDPTYRPKPAYNAIRESLPRDQAFGGTTGFWPNNRREPSTLALGILNRVRAFLRFPSLLP